MNVLRRNRKPDPGLEEAVTRLVRPLADSAPSASRAEAARRALLAATGEPAMRHRLSGRRRLALGAAALVAPLMAVTAVGAVGAVTGQEQLSGPADVITTAGKAVGIGGKSGAHRQDAQHRSAESGNVGQPGSCPGRSCEARAFQDEEDEAAPEAAQEPAGGEAGDEPGTQQGPPEGVPPAHAGADPHANGKGCDDKLFAGGQPPFGGPNGPKFETPVGPCGDPEPGENEGEEGEEASGRPDNPGEQGRARAAEAKNGVPSGEPEDSEEVEPEETEEE